MPSVLVYVTTRSHFCPMPSCEFRTGDKTSVRKHWNDEHSRYCDICFRNHFSCECFDFDDED